MRLTELPKRSAIAGIRLYQVTLSPYLGRQCRFYPTCSHYGREAFEQHGFLRGMWLTIRRLGRCQPFHPGGVDMVPPRAGTSLSAADHASGTKES